MRREKGFTVFITNAMASKQWWAPCGSIHFSKAQNRGAGPERSPSLQPLPYHQFIPNTTIRLVSLKHYPEHHKNNHSSPFNESLTLNFSTQCLWWLSYDPVPRQNLQWPHQPFHSTCFILNSAVCTCHLALVTCYHIWLLLCPPNDHKYLETREYILCLFGSDLPLIFNTLFNKHFLKQ